MTPLEALLAATAAGIRLTVIPETRKLRAEWDQPVERVLLDALKEHRDWLIEHLLVPPSPPSCPRCARPQHEAGDYVCPDPPPPDRSYPVAPPWKQLVPVRPCPDCHTAAWWQRPDGGVVCGTCHPARVVPIACTEPRQEVPME